MFTSPVPPRQAQSTNVSPDMNINTVSFVPDESAVTGTGIAARAGLLTYDNCSPDKVFTKFFS